MYTMENSINDILRDELVMRHYELLLSKMYLYVVPEEFRDMPFKDLPFNVSMPWGKPYISKEALEAANNVLELQNRDKYEFVKLWAEETPENYYPDPDGTRDSVSLLLFKESFVQGRKLALVCPGGGYANVCISHEGMHTAKVLEEKGYAVATLNYRCASNKYPIPQEDLALCIKYLRAYAIEKGVEDDLLLVGYSAGGHLIASESCYADEYDAGVMEKMCAEFPKRAQLIKNMPAKADKLCVAYGVTNFEEPRLEECYRNLAGNNDSIKDKMSVVHNVDSSYPKTFAWACQDDELVPCCHASKLCEALKENGVEAMCKLYPSGGHGIATGEGTSAWGWVDEMVEFMG